MNKRHVLIGALGGGLLMLGALGGLALKALADGIPSPNPLYYSGTLTENGSPVNAPRHLTINLWTTAMPQTGEVALCATDVPATPVINGRFRINLDSTCKSKINANPDVYAEVVVGGNTTLGRSKIGSVPFAVEADHAVNATNVTGPQAQQFVPSGGVMAFNLTACPGGWSPLVSAQGRTVVGANATAGSGLSVRNLGDIIGEEQHTLTIAEMPSHNHAPPSGDAILSYNAGGANGVVASPAAQVSDNNVAAVMQSAGGGLPHNNMQPSLVLLYCQKN